MVIEFYVFSLPSYIFLYNYAKSRFYVLDLSYIQNVFLSKKKQFDHFFTDLLGLHSKDNWIQGGRQQQIELGY